MHTASVLIGLAQFWSYVGISTALQFYYYYYKEKDIKGWKIRDDLTIHQTLSEEEKNKPQNKLQLFYKLWWFPYKWMIYNSASKPNRHPLHVPFAIINLGMSCMFITFVTEAFLNGYGSLKSFSSLFPTTLFTSNEHEYSLSFLLLGFLFSVVFQCVVEYYWHRMNHTRFFYVRFHKHHHYYKAPQPFDDLMIHPVEGFGYYCILYAPAILIPQPLLSFIMYMAIMGVCGILDHSGIIFNFPLYLNSYIK